jgi:transposase-like protein
VPLRKLADENELSLGATYRQIENELEALPDNTSLSRNYCNRWSGRLVIDGKYVKVKGYDEKIPFIYYGIDYLTHDIPVGLLAPSENYFAMLKLFSLLKSINYPLQLAVSDENAPLGKALFISYPRAKLQLCHNHYLENIRESLLVRTEEEFKGFFFELRQAFRARVSSQKRNTLFGQIYQDYVLDENREQKKAIIKTIMADVQRKYGQLFVYEKSGNDYLPHSPQTTNIVESYNSHIQGRLKSIKGFESFYSAKRFLNAWLIRRRTKTLTDCNQRFKHLNGFAPLQMSLKRGLPYPQILGLNPPKKHP